MTGRLIEKPPRRESGYLQYPQDTVSRLRFIMRAKGLGFTLKEIRDLLDLQIDTKSASTCDEVRRLAEEKISCIRGKILTLQRMEVVLVKMVGNCRRRAVTCGCPILEAIQQEGSRENNRNGQKQTD
jgi:DNA-binding transcriptional MerR regulator